MFRKNSVVLLLILAIILIIGAPALAKPTHQSSLALKIGYIGQAESDLARGLRLAINEVNAAGGVLGPNSVTYTFELVVAEVAPDDSAGVTTALQNLTNQQVIAIFGPDTNGLADPNVASLSGAPVPVLTAATSDNLSNQDTNANIFRIVAPDSVYNTALATYLASERRLTRIVVVQTNTNLNTAVVSFNTTLNQLNTPPIQLIQVTDSTQLLNNIVTLPELNPDAVVFFGSSIDAVAVLSELRENSWGGVFAYRGTQPLIVGADQDEQLLTGVIGVDSWSFGATDELGSIFIANYVAEFGAVPSALSVAGYDAFYSLIQVIRTGGPAPAVLRQTLPQLRDQVLVRGPVSPALYGNRSLSRTAVVYELTGFGGARAVSVYDNGIKREDIGTPIAQQPTNTPTPTPSLTPTVTPQPSATPSVVTGTVNQNVLNVRQGPGTEYAQVDQLRRNDQVTIAGRNDNFTWLFVQYQGRVGWIFAEFVTIFDPGGLVALLPFVPPPATPTPGPTQAPVDADLIITNVTLTPSQPQPGVPFSATVTIQNVGSTNAGTFAVATSFLPGDVFTAQNLGGLAAGQTVTTTLTATVTATGFVPDLAIVVDLNQEVFEGPAGSIGESNNIYTLAYKVDRTVIATATTTLSPGISINFHGPDLDMSWDGATLMMSTVSGMARIGAMPFGQTFENTHYDQVPTYATSTSLAAPAPGTVLAIITNEGYRGFMRVDGLAGANITITYRIYTP